MYSPERKTFFLLLFAKQSSTISQRIILSNISEQYRFLSQHYIAFPTVFFFIIFFIDLYLFRLLAIVHKIQLRLGVALLKHRKVKSNRSRCFIFTQTSQQRQYYWTVFERQEKMKEMCFEKW